MTPTHVCAQQAVFRPVPGALLPPLPGASGYGLSDERPGSEFSDRVVPDGLLPETVLARLDGASILLVEDEAIVAMDIKFALTDAGADVLGPAVSLPDALSLALETMRIDGAILDIDLGGEDVFRLADLLVSRSVPFIFHTGGPPVAGIEARFPKAGLLRKPVSVEDLLMSLAQQMG